MKTILLGGAAAFVLGTAAIAQVPATGKPVAKVHTRAEVAAKVERHFARADVNRDGAITQDEAKAAHSAMADRKAKHGARVGKGEGFFARLDTNKDGNVTRAEFDAARAARAQNQAANAQARPNRGEAMFARLDTNRDGAISRAEFDAGRAQREQRMAGKGKADGDTGMRGHMFTMADANKDGRVTLPEAQAAALRHFDMIDANKDGTITPEERRQMRGHMQHGQHQG